MNDFGQLALGSEVSAKLKFFPEFRKIDIYGKDNAVIDAAFGAASLHVISNGGKMQAVGDNAYGQFGNGTTIASYDL